MYEVQANTIYLTDPVPANQREGYNSNWAHAYPPNPTHQGMNGVVITTGECTFNNFAFDRRIIGLQCIYKSQALYMYSFYIHVPQLIVC